MLEESFEFSHCEIFKKNSAGASDSTMGLNLTVQWLRCFFALALFLGALGQNFTDDTSESNPKMGKGKILFTKF